MSRSALVALLAFLAVPAVVLLSPAHAEPPTGKVVCTQVPQGVGARPGMVDEQFVATFMSEQLAAGRERFTTVQGISTVLCAY